MRANPDDSGWDPRADVQQYHNGVNINGHDTDLDRAKDLSAFWTKENEDMTAPTNAQMENAVWHTEGSAKAGQSAGTTLGATYDNAVAGAAQSKANGGSLTEIKAKLDGMTSGSVDIDALVAALRPVIAEEIGIALNKTGTTFTLNYSG